MKKDKQLLKTKKNKREKKEKKNFFVFLE